MDLQKFVECVKYILSFKYLLTLKISSVKIIEYF